MKRLLFGLVALPFLAGVSLAAQPVPLSDGQMDAVTAGFDFGPETDIQNLGTVRVAIDLPATPTTGTPPVSGPPNGCIFPGGCFVSISGTAFPSGVQSFQLNAVFGP